MKRVSRRALIIVYAFSSALPITGHASPADETFKRFTQTLDGTLRCRAYHHDTDYTLVGDPDAGEIVFSAKRGSKALVSNRRLSVRSDPSGLAMSLSNESDNTSIKVSALKNDIDAFGDNVDYVEYFYMGSVVYAVYDSSPSEDFFTAFHGACRLEE